MRPIPEYGDLMTVGDFLASCQCGLFIDYDGQRCLATETEMSSVTVYPSNIEDMLVEHPQYTHVVWFNR
jgi:hypothetical protein